MKRIAFLLALLLVCGIVFGCVEKAKPDVWDGSVADAFAGGSGTEKDPYRIATAAQLAYLAKSVNEGNDYSGKVLVLTTDIDLNNREWTPIGNGDCLFDGTFDGKEHTISNLSITKRTEYIYNAEDGIVCTICVSGLFGICRNVTIRNLSVCGASVSVPEKEPYNGYIYAGILAGRILPDTSCSVSNVRISEAHIYSVRSEFLFAIGGMIGELYGKNNAESVSCTLDRLQCFVSVYRQYSWGSSCYIGGIVGEAYGTLTMVCKNFRSDLTLESTERDEPSAGAFGWLGGTPITLDNGVGFVRVSPTYGFPQSTHAIVGGEKNVLFGAEVHCKNLFGCVMPKDEKALEIDSRRDFRSDKYREDQQQALFTLYVIQPNADRGGSLTEENCVACETLPETHGLDPKIWDLSDLADPKLK